MLRSQGRTKLHVLGYPYTDENQCKTIVLLLFFAKDYNTLSNHYIQIFKYKCSQTKLINNTDFMGQS